MEGFDKFCINKNYIAMKNSLFNYLNRKREIKAIFNRILTEKRVIIDIGSGMSPVTPVPEKTLFIDVSKEGLNYLKKEGYKTKYGSITKIPLDKDSVDIIFCSEVLEHIQNYKIALDEMNRILKKRGKLIITIPVYKKYWGVDDEFVGHFRRFEPKEFISDLENSGFLIINEKPIGSRFERGITKLIVKIFKNQENINLTKTKVYIGRIINYFIYFLVRCSLFFSSKKDTSIMLYYCEKK